MRWGKTLKMSLVATACVCLCGCALVGRLYGIDFFPADAGRTGRNAFAAAN
jgi:hypothetical protein